jgi:CRISPR/Cas system-associated protein Cas10 (large subunit of type III CRISPR-Cas system)
MRPLSFSNLITVTFKVFLMAVLMQCTPMFMRAAHATTGGDDGFSVMGIDKNENKVFFAISDGDGSGYVDSIYYIDIASPTRSIFAKSLYTTGNIEDCWDACEKFLEQKTHQIKKRLRPLNPTHTANLRWQIVSQVTRTIPWHGDPDSPTPEYDTHYQVIFEDGKKTLEGQGHVIYYNNSLNIHQVFEIPNRSEMLVVIEYTGKAFEFGYKKYDVILLTPKH